MTRTLDDMTPDERAECVGIWAERKHRLVVITAVSERVRAADWFCPATVSTGWDGLAELSPRLDLPRAWTPSGEPVDGEWEESASTPSIRRWCARWEQKPWEVPHESR